MTPLISDEVAEQHLRNIRASAEACDRDAMDSVELGLGFIITLMFFPAGALYYILHKSRRRSMRRRIET